MGTVTGTRRLRIGVPRALPLILGPALALGLLAPTAVLAADPTFGEATATSVFGDAVTVEQRVTLPAGVTRVEAYVRSPESTSTFLATIDNPGPGQHTLRYRDDTPQGSVFPNTPLELGFRITLVDGSFVDGPPARIRYEDDRFTWRTLEGDLVRIHWYEGDQSFGRRALDIGERAVAEAAALLGVVESSPIDFYVYADRSAFYDVLGPSFQENVGGLAIPEIRTLFANISPSEVADPWVSIVVPHELTHVVFDTATRNRYHAPPHWLNEGLADYLAQGYTSDARRAVERAAANDDLMPLRALVLRFPSTASRFSLAYDESVSAIDYLIRAYGQDDLVALIRSYADGVADDDAFGAALGVDAAAFEAAWLGDLGVRAPVPYGPVPAPVGPLPPGWGAAPQPTGPPVATPPPVVDERAELGSTILIGVIILFGVVVVFGILVVARGLDRGQPLPGSGIGTGSGPGGAPGAGFRSTGWPPVHPGDGDGDGGDPTPSLAELDARLAPPGTAEAGLDAHSPDDPTAPTADGTDERAGSA